MTTTWAAAVALDRQQKENRGIPHDDNTVRATGAGYFRHQLLINVSSEKSSGQ
jgi:hypothetical protein